MDIKASRILLVDDEKQLQCMVKDILIESGFEQIDTASDASQADFLYRNKEYHLVLLDVMLPDMDGFSLYELWNKQRGDVPVIFLSAKDEDKDRLRGLGLRADDYITKPFLPEELVLRIKAVLRRTYNMTFVSSVMIGNVSVDFSAGTILKEGEEIALTAKEHTLLLKLFENRGKIVSINNLMDALWPDGSYGYENSLMVHVRRLREKIEDDPSNPEYLQTIRGLGYRLK